VPDHADARAFFDGLTWQRAEGLAIFFGRGLRFLTLRSRGLARGGRWGASTAAAIGARCRPHRKWPTDGVPGYAHVPAKTQGPIPMQKLESHVDRIGDVRSERWFGERVLDDLRGAAGSPARTFTASSAGAGSNARRASMAAVEAGGDSADSR